MSEWREPTAAERELLRVVLLADFPERDTLQACLVGSRVRTSCDCGCGSLEFQSDPPEAVPTDLEFELDALTRSGSRTVVALRRRGNRGLFLEITALGDSGELVEIAPESVRQSDVAHVKRGVIYRVPRQVTVVEEASRRRH